MRQLLLLIAIMYSINVTAQEPKKSLFKSLYEDFLKYGTIYGAGDVSNSIEAKENVFFVRTPPGASLYDIPVLVDDTPDYPFDFRYGFGIRKLARFSYERKPKNFYDGRSEEHTSELQSRLHLVCRLLLEKKNKSEFKS